MKISSNSLIPQGFPVVLLFNASDVCLIKRSVEKIDLSDIKYCGSDG